MPFSWSRPDIIDAELQNLRAKTDASFAVTGFYKIGETWSHDSLARRAKLLETA